MVEPVLGKEARARLFADHVTGRRFTLPWVGTLEPLRGSGLVDWWREQPLLAYGRQRTDPREGERTGYLSDPDTDPIDTPAWEPHRRMLARLTAAIRTKS